MQQKYWEAERLIEKITGLDEISVSLISVNGPQGKPHLSLKNVCPEHELTAERLREIADVLEKAERMPDEPAPLSPRGLAGLQQLAADSEPLPWRLTFCGNHWHVKTENGTSVCTGEKRVTNLNYAAQAINACPRLEADVTRLRKMLEAVMEEIEELGHQSTACDNVWRYLDEVK